MLVLIGIGFLAGVVTAISPCVLPVLPILLAGSADGPRRRPLAIIGGLVASFTVFTLFAAALLDLVGLPQDFLRNLAIALLFVVAATLIVPPLGELLARPFLPLTRRRGGDLGGGFLLGASLGLVFVPCAGPVLAAVTVVAAQHRVDASAFVLTLAYAAGAALPMLLIALGGQRMASRTRAFRTHAPTVRRALGVVIALTALAIAFHQDRRFQTAIPGYTEALQERIERSGTADRRLERLRRGVGGAQAADLPTLAAAPEFAGISRWLNTPGGKPLSLAGLRGKVVLIDFWTYSCINCLRTLPHLKAWDRTYRDRGLTIVGVHTPEFAFERVPANVEDAAGDLGVRYPIALDPDYDTWDAYQNQYWPAKYLIDRRGQIRYTHFGEGEYEHTESLIRKLLAERAGELPKPTAIADPTPRAPLTPETYLGYERIDRYAGSQIVPDRLTRYQLPKTLYRDELGFRGTWRVERERSVAGPGAALILSFRSRDVHLVLTGRGTVRVFLNGSPVRTVRVGASRLYTLVEQLTVADGVLELRFSPGIAAYAFTFG